MATTRLMPLHAGKGRNTGSAIRSVIGYVSNPGKTRNGGRTGNFCWPSGNTCCVLDARGARMM